MSMSDRFDIFAMSIGLIYRSLQRIKNREMTEVNLKGVHVMCLHTLNHNPGGMTLTALSQACEEDKAAMSRTIAELTRRGLVTTSTEAKYRAPIILTDTGRETAAKVDEMINEAVDAGGNGLTDAERAEFYRMHRLISNNHIKYLKEDCQHVLGKENLLPMLPTDFSYSNPVSSI